MSQRVPHRSKSWVEDPLIRGEQSLIVLSAEQQKLLDGEYEYASNFNGLPSIRSVANYVVQLVYELDDPEFIQGKNRIREVDHWEHYRHKHIRKVLAKPFPAHAIISVADNAMVDEVARYLQRIFETDRIRFPGSKGWNAKGVHCRSTIPLGMEHPFYRYKQTGQLDANCCRFLVVNQMAVEGINNKYLLIWGVAEYIDSATVLIQRAGRFLRTAAILVDDVLNIPPASHDIVRIVTHETFGPAQLGKGKGTTASNIRRAIYYIRHMREETAGLMTLDEFVALESGTGTPHTHRPTKALSLADKYAIAQLVAAGLVTGSLPDVEEIVRQSQSANTEYMEAIRAEAGQGSCMDVLRAYAQSLIRNESVTYTAEVDGAIQERTIDALTDFRSSMLQYEPPDAEPVLEAERLYRAPLTVDDATIWLNRYSWGERELGNREPWGDEAWLVHIDRLRNTVEGHADILEFEFDESPAELIRTLAHKTAAFLHIPAKLESVERLVLEGARHRLSPVPVGGMADLDYGGPLCKSCVTFALRSESFQRQLLKWITFRLLDAGELSGLDVLFSRRHMGRHT